MCIEWIFSQSSTWIIFQSHQDSQIQSHTISLIFNKVTKFRVTLKRCRGKDKPEQKLFKLFNRNENLTGNRLNHNPFYPFRYKTNRKPTSVTRFLFLSRCIFNVWICCLFFLSEAKIKVFCLHFTFELRWPSLISGKVFFSCCCYWSKRDSGTCSIRYFFGISSRSNKRAIRTQSTRWKIGNRSVSEC